MTQTFGQNSAGDIYIGLDGNLVVLAGLAAVEAACRTATLAQLGEMVLATTSGTPNFGALWTGTPEYTLWKSSILNTIQNVEGIQQVTSLNLTISGKQVGYVANITTQYGTGTVTQ